MHLNFQDKLIIDNSHEVSIRYVQIQVWSWTQPSLRKHWTPSYLLPSDLKLITYSNSDHSQMFEYNVLC